jgi:hypothetical protein
MGSPPVIILMKEALGEPSREQRHAPPRKTVLQLPVQTQIQTHALAKSRGGDEIDDIIQTNSITQSRDESARHLAVVPEVAVCRLSSIVQCLLWQLLIITHSASTMTAVQTLFPSFRGAERVQKQPKIQSHAYASSAYYRFDDKTGKTLMLQVFALRDIKTEKEILFNCVPPSRY